MSESTSPPKGIRLIDFEVFKKFSKFPRYPDCESSIIYYDSLTEEQKKEGLFIFISHAWVGTQNPDDESTSKYKLSIRGIQELMTILYLGKKKCYIWFDYSCINQDNVDTNELTCLNKIMTIFTCTFTPIHDPGHESWTFPSESKSILRDYAAEGFQKKYLNRAWCLTEMFCTQFVPLCNELSSNGSERNPIGLELLQALGFRPHFVYGTKEMSTNSPPLFMEPLQMNTHLQKYSPVNGILTKESDRDKIISLMDDIQKSCNSNQDDNNVKEGLGKKINENGELYAGEWKEGKYHGNGILIYPNGSSYYGMFQSGKKWGSGQFFSCHGVNGDRISGELENDCIRSNVTHIYPNGSIYQEFWSNGRKEELGTLYITNGEVNGDVCHGFFKNDTVIGRLDDQNNSMGLLEINNDEEQPVEMARKRQKISDEPISNSKLY